jgi:hypothetical protein
MSGRDLFLSRQKRDEKRSLPDIYGNDDGQDAQLFMTFTIVPALH